MKHRKTYIILSLTMLSLTMASCNLIGNNDKEIDPQNIYGLWQEGTLYERYSRTPMTFLLENDTEITANGKTWDTNDDVDESEAQPFDWTLNGTTLQQSHIMFTGAVVPKTYTVTELTSSVLVYKDNYGTTHNFTKVTD